MTKWVGRAALLPLLMVWCVVKGTEAPSVTIQFYSSTLEFPYLYCSELEMDGPVSRAMIIDAYEHLQNCDPSEFLARCQDYRRNYQLGDWHFFEIIALASEKMYQSEKFQAVFQWFMLRKALIDAQLFYRDNQLYVYAASPDAEFGFYTIERNQKRYVNLTAWREGVDLYQRQTYLPEFLIDPTADRNFWFHISSLPNLPSPRIIRRKIYFQHKGQTFSCDVNLNKDHLEMMDRYPYYSQVQFFHMDMSAEAEKSLLPQLEAYMEGWKRVQKVEFLLSFVRTAFFYKEDHEEFGHEKPMSPEQTLYYSYSDCEDRSALFFYLVRRLLDLPVIVIDFDEHVGVAIELAEVKGDYFTHKGRRFVYCEATGPDDALAIGEMWDYVRSQRARVLTEYLP